jgi:ribosome-associated toxin RatA of RatAB toxin-antitoxin module
MREVKRSALIAESPARMYELINDIESYPQFLPWCTSARVVSRKENEVVAALGIKRGPLRTEFTTRNLLEPGKRVLMQLVSGPFRVLEGLWTLTAVGDLGCRVELEMRFEFSNRVAGAVFEPLFEDTAASLVDAFVKRAREQRAAE